jgi:hypothetical protein
MSRMNHEHRNRMDRTRRPVPSKKRVLQMAGFINMKSKYESNCLTCGQKIKVGANIYYEVAAKKAHHAGCVNKNV